MGDRLTIAAFAGCGIELEYIIVDRRTLDVRPLAGELLARMAGRRAASVDRGKLGWSNELVCHVVELKNLAPDPSLATLAQPFQREIAYADDLLAAHQARLMPTGMHPWMDPVTETRLWPHGDDTIYRAFDRVFDCRRHGWANLQSMHVNLPFANDVEFARLHAAIRCVLPIVPALAASSPIADGQRQRALDHRLEVYRTNAAAIPAITGDVIPENVDSRDDYERTILAPMYRAIAQYDPDGTLAHEWLNARGAIARFMRNAIEIRLADTQECPRADLAVATAVVGVVKALYDERWEAYAQQRAQPTHALAALLRACILDAEQTRIADAGYLALFGFPGAQGTARALWAHLLRTLAADDAHAWCSDSWRVMLEHGPLARRIDRATGPDSSHAHLHEVYSELCDCLAKGRMFEAA